MADLPCNDPAVKQDAQRVADDKKGDAGVYLTEDGHLLTNEMLETEAELYEKGERPKVWREPDPRQVNLTLPAWVIAAADAEAARINVSRRAVLNFWLAEKAEQALERMREHPNPLH